MTCSWKKLRIARFKRTCRIASLGVVIVATLLVVPVLGSGQQPSGPGNAAPAAPVATPRTADGHPELSGLWTGPAGGGGGGGAAINDSLGANGFAPTVLASRNDRVENFFRDMALTNRMSTNRPLYKPQYWETVRKLDANSNEDDPALNCLPAGVPRMGPPQQIIQTPTQLIFLYVGVGSAIATPAAYRVIAIDGRPHTPLQELDGTWNGESIGHWEGDTMVLDTIGFNSSSWLGTGGYFHSENMRVTERLTRSGNTLSWQAIVDDPDVLLKPWEMDSRTVRLNSNEKALLPESLPCSERDGPHYVTKEHH